VFREQLYRIFCLLLCIKGKVPGLKHHTMKVYQGIEVIAPRIPHLCSRWRRVFSFTSGVIDPATHWIGRWVDLAVMDAMSKGNLSLLPPAGNSTLVVQHVAYPSSHFVTFTIGQLVDDVKISRYCAWRNQGKQRFKARNVLHTKNRAV